MIQKIGQRVEFNKNKSVNLKGNSPTQSPSQLMYNTIESKRVDSALLQKYYVSFGATKKSEKLDKKTILEENYTSEAERLTNTASSIAKEFGHPKIDENHIELAILLSIQDYIKDLDSGKKIYKEESSYQLPVFFASILTSDLFKEKKELNKIEPIINEEIKLLEETLAKTPPKTIKGTPQLSEDMVDKIFDTYRAIMTASETDQAIPITEKMFAYTLLDAEDGESDNNFEKFMLKMSEAVMSDRRKPKEKVHLNIYDEKAKNILKNISLGSNIFITHDTNSSPMYLVDSIVDVFNNQDSEFGKLNKKNTKIHVFNDNIKEDFILHKLKELSKDKETNSILIMDEDSLLVNSAQTLEAADGSLVKSTGFSNDFLAFLRNQPKNIKIIFMEEKNSYYSNMSKPGFPKLFENFVEVPFPVLNTEQTKKAFKEQPLLMDKVDVPFNKPAIDKTIEVAAMLEGTYPEKAQKLMRKIAAYYIDKKEITEKDVSSYVEKAKDSFKLTGEDSSVDIVFDTRVKLKDIIGKSATKKEAEAIVKQIKNDTLGIKGAMIYAQDGSSGGGRRYTATAIAGETKSPYIEIDAKDFGTERVNILGGGALTPENSIKKVFSLVRTQAEANPNKSAVVFIENFEYLTFGEMISEFYPKAMSQLKREMENASKKGLNILILGSVTDSYLAEQCAEKEYKFFDKIEVESPSRNIQAREEIITNAIKERKIKIAGSTDSERQELIKLMAETTYGFPFVYLTNIVNKSKNVSLERGHKQVEKADVTEAYLQLISGRPSSGPISEHRKKIVTSHECGHALNLEVMWNLAEKQDIPWHIPNKVNFITLDPRGDFGGAMFHKDGGNEEHSFETFFSNLICAYGGHSAEKLFYNIDGSWGITGDLEQITDSANMAVRYMGLGHYTGKKSVLGMHQHPSGREKANMDKDTDIMMKNSLTISDMITEVYADFNKEFTQKYAKLVGTGDCLVQGDVFRQELNEWLKKQPKEKLDEIATLDAIIIKAIKATKDGQLY